MIRERLGKELLYFDGGMGTLLQAKGLQPGELPETWNVTHADEIKNIHKQYISAGSDIVLANTFGANALKFHCDDFPLEEIIRLAIRHVKDAAEEAGGGRRIYTALDVGPTGKLLKPMGDLDFETAYETFKEVMILGEKAGADLIHIETMSDTYELKAAVLAAKENTSLPVFATTIFDERGKLLTGADVPSVVAMLEGLRIDALGINCGMGPEQMLPILEQIMKYSSVPVIVKPNAGLPKQKDGETYYDVSPEEFAKQEHGPIFEDIIKNGKLKVGIIGNNPTFCFHTVKDGKDELVGFEVEGMYEMAKRLSDYLGREVTVDFYESDFTGCMSALQANQVYFVTRLSPTDERKKTWLFTDVYHKSDECYVAKKDNENSDMFTGTLKGVKVAGQMGSIDITMTKYLYPDAEIQELDNTPNMLLAVKNGKADLACMNAVSAAMSVAANDDLVVVDKLTWEPTDEFDKGCGLCMAYGNEDFANWCNGFFSDIKAEGLWDQMQSDAAAELHLKALEDFIAQ